MYWRTIKGQDFTLNTLAKRITGQWDIPLFSTYASTEMGTAFTECKCQKGGHHHPGLIIAELLDRNNQPVVEGEPGDLTITTLGIEGMPLVRFKTGDIMQQHTEPCKCGRTTMRLGPVIGRKKQMIKYKGTTLYPPAMMDLLNHFNGIECHIIELSTNDIGTDEILVRIAAKEPTDSFMETIKTHFRDKLRVTPKLEFVEKEILLPLIHNPKSRKPIYIFDKRKPI